MMASRQPIRHGSYRVQAAGGRLVMSPSAATLSGNYPCLHFDTRLCSKTHTNSSLQRRGVGTSEVSQIEREEIECGMSYFSPSFGAHFSLFSELDLLARANRSRQ